jgi:MFS family permease
MVIGRFSSDSLTTKFGRAPILLFCGTFVGLGLSTGLLIGGQIAIVLAWFAMGIGASVVIPMVFSVAGSLAKNEYSDVVAPSQAVATVSGISYAAFLFGPPIIGFAADIISLRWAMLIPAFLALGIVFGSRIAKQVN